MRVTIKQLGCAALFVLVTTASGQVTVEEIRTKALAAWNVNEAQAKDVLYLKESWSEYTGHTTGLETLLTGPQEVHTQTPVFRDHFETVNGQPRYVMDGWADQLPLAQRFRDSKQRINYGPNVLDRGVLVREFLGPGRQLNLIETKTDRGHAAYVVESKGRATVQGGRGATAKCPSAMDAVLHIDTVTFFPLRVEATVAQPNMCSSDASSQFDHPGAQVQFHQIKVSGKDRCGEPHNIYVVDQAALIGNMGQVDGAKEYAGSIAERVFILGPGYRGGTRKQIAVSSKFQLFVTSACILTEGPPASPSVDLVETESYFPLDGMPATVRDLARRLSGADANRPGLGTPDNVKPQITANGCPTAQVAVDKNQALNAAYAGGRQALGVGRYDVAIDNLIKAACIDDKQVSVWSLLGEAYFRAAPQEPSLWERAADAYRRATSLTPNDKGLYENYANAQFQYGLALAAKATADASGRVVPFPGAIEALRKYLDLKPDGPSAPSAREIIKALGGR